MSELIEESVVPVHTFGFIFNAVHTRDVPDKGFEDLSTTTINIFANNAEFQTFQYTARRVGEVAVALRKTVRF